MFKVYSSFILTLMTVNQCNNVNIPYFDSSQLIVVKSKSWDSINADIELYEKNSEKIWIKIQETIPSVLGKKGLGWGRGIYSSIDAKNNTFRQEGDKRAPAGIFTIGETFGIMEYEEAKQKLNLKMPYTYLTDTIQCIGEGKSKYYNSIIDTSKVIKDWENDKNNELMRFEGLRDEQAYKWGVFINHNVDINPNQDMKKDNNAGSCIFIHIWKNQNTGTSGCTAISEKNIEKIISWLDYRKKPLIVQLPEPEYLRLKNKWNLP
jgi:L,D-peptidoglycan transpeptidase YkuD (ErfK/YbiS/YcfS/YnhG family)